MVEKIKVDVFLGNLSKNHLFHRKCIFIYIFGILESESDVISMIKGKFHPQGYPQGHN